MLSDYYILGLDTDASDSDIRRQYLSLIKKYTPEKSPRRFQDITESYERIKSRRLAIKNQLVSIKLSETESIFSALGRSVNVSRRCVGLPELLADAGLRVRDES